MTSRSGFARSNCASEPEAMIASVPFSAPDTPPLTGASMNSMRRRSSAAATSMAVAGPVVDRSTTSFAASSKAMFIQHNGAHRGRGRKTQQHDVSAVRKLLRRPRNVRFGTGELHGVPASYILHHELVVGVAQTRGHGMAHVPEPHESDATHTRSP